MIDDKRLTEVICEEFFFMLPIVRKSIISICLFAFVGTLFLQCSCSKRNQKDVTVVKIDAYTLTANEFEELFQEHEMEDTPENRAGFLNNLITRKLLLEEAQKQGWDTQKDFLRSIENFWEQSLLRLVVDQKVKEIAKNITVTESEVESYYQKWVKENPETSKPLQEMRNLIEWRIQKAKEAQTMEEWTNHLIQKAHIEVDKKAIGVH